MAKIAATALIAASTLIVKLDSAIAQNPNDCKISECMQRMVSLAEKLIVENQNLRARLEVVETTQRGLIAHFALAKCPEGWEAYTPAEGRFVLGTSGAKIANSLTSETKAGAQGGFESVRLSSANMPQHDHLSELGTGNGEGIFGQGDAHPRTIFGVSRGSAHLSRTAPSGNVNPQPIVTVPPFVALLSCQKK